MKSKLVVNERYEVHWNDAFLLTTWVSVEDAKKEKCQCVTIGYYVGETENGDLLFAATLNERDKELGSVQGRPKGMIREIYKLNKGKRVK